MSSNKKFKVTAVVAIRNGSFYFPRLCKHARDNGILLAVIDNDSEDNLQDLIVENSDVVIKSERLKYDGYFDLVKQLEAKERMIQTLTTDWVIHLDVDELLFSDTHKEPLVDALLRVQNAGFNAINFDEFVFLPIERIKRFHSENYDTMNWYYFFEPRQNRLVRAFRKNLRTQITSGGHNVEGEVKLYPNNMIMRHYMFENRKHAKKKYRFRQYSIQDIENKFHGNRTPLQNNKLAFPTKKSLKRSALSDWSLDKSDPKKNHFWQWS